MEKRIIIFRFDTLSTMQCYSSEITLKVDAIKPAMEHWENYLTLLPKDSYCRYVARKSTINSKAYVTYENVKTGEVYYTLVAIRYKWEGEKDFKLL